MNDYKYFTVITVAAGHWEKGGIWIAGAEVQSTVCGQSAPGNRTRNRNPEGSNETKTQSFWLFVDEWNDENVILDEGQRYTTQSFQPWPKFMAIEGLLEAP